MSTKKRLVAALDSFVNYRTQGVRRKRHLVPIVEFVAAELRGRGIRAAEIEFEVPIGKFFERRVDLIVRRGSAVDLTLLIITQSGSIRKNLNNRRRDMVGDAVNLRASNPTSRIGVVYLLRANVEATRKGSTGSSPVDELAEFLADLQKTPVGATEPLVDAAALVAADRDETGRIFIEAVPRQIDVLGEFFTRLVADLPKRR